MFYLLKTNCFKTVLYVLIVSSVMGVLFYSNLTLFVYNSSGQIEKIIKLTSQELLNTQAPLESEPITWQKSLNAADDATTIANLITSHSTNYSTLITITTNASISRENVTTPVNFVRNSSQLCTYSTDTNKTDFKNEIITKVLELDEIESVLKNEHSLKLINGGKSFTQTSHNCSTSGLEYKKVAFIVPYRNRENNLKTFLLNMHLYFNRLKIDYGIYIIEPVENITFNRGLLMNIGFVESIRDGIRFSEPSDSTTTTTNSNQTYWDCFIFHDVDMIPEDERVAYTCNQSLPVHLAVAVSKFGYSTNGYFAKYFGGITAFTREQYENVNGFSNLYFGWGAEDDDLYSRAIYKYKNIIKLDAQIARFTMGNHEPDTPNPQRLTILNSKLNKINQEGIVEGLSTLKYEVKTIVKTLLFTKIYVSYDKNSILNEMKIRR